MGDVAHRLTAAHLQIRRGRRKVVNDLSLSLDNGVTAILGPNGAGKTTLLEGLSNPQLIESGSVRLDDKNVESQNLKWYFGASGYLPQNWSFYPGFSVAELLTYSAWIKGLSRARARSATSSIMSLLDLTSLADKQVKRLSGGMRQRVAIAETFVHSPSVVFLDEPTVSLDPEQRSIIRRFIQERASTSSVVFSTHLTEDVAAIADRVVIVADGQKIFDGKAESLTSRVSDGRADGLEDAYLSIVRAEGQAQ